MDGVLHELPPSAAVAVLRLRSLGDCVLTTPAIHLLKSARPDIRIAVVVEERFAPVFSGNPDVDALLPPSVSAVRRWRPELCLNLHGGTRSLALAAASGARFRAGFAHFRASGMYNIRIPTAQEVLGVSRKVHTAEHLASAIFHLGVPAGTVGRARLFALPLSAEGPYAVLHPIASAPHKTWRSDGFLEVARHLAREHGLEPVFIGGPGEDLTAFAPFRTVSGAPLETIKSLIAGASLFVGNDSGPAHIAAAFGIPLVVIFGSSDPVVWAPWRVEAEVIVSEGPVQSVEAGQVTSAVDRLRVAR